MNIIDILKSGTVFLGGTVYSDWRESLMKQFDEYGIKYHNPIVPDWTPEKQKEEDRIKVEECSVHLYVITPEQYGSYSAAEITDAAWRTKVTQKPKYMIYVLTGNWDKAKLSSWVHTGELAESINPEKVKFIKVNTLNELFVL